MSNLMIQCKVGEYAVPHAVFEAYSALHPTAEQEFAQMVIWLESNPARRPASAKTAPRFLANWFRRVPKRVVRKADFKADAFRQLSGRSDPSWQNSRPTFVVEQPRDPATPWLRLPQ